MADIMTKEQRSRCMSRIRGKWTGMEREAHNLLKATHIPHRMHPDIEGHPDILLPPRTLLFLDSCFWHCCPEHFRMPESNRGYWRAKLERNRMRDRETTKKLRKKGYTVVRMWEHDIRKGALKEWLGRRSDGKSGLE